MQREFRQALQGQILPSLEASLKQMLSNLEKKLQQVDVALCEKLAEEEDRWRAMQTQYQNSLSWLKLFHKKVGQMAQEMIRQQMREQAQHLRDLVSVVSTASAAGKGLEAAQASDRLARYADYEPLFGDVSGAVEEVWGMLTP